MALLPYFWTRLRGNSLVLYADITFSGFQEERSKPSKPAAEGAVTDLITDDELEAMRQETLAEEAATNESAAAKMEVSLRF